MSDRGLYKPPEWGEGLILQNCSSGLYQVDDRACTFSDSKKHDMTAFFRYPDVYAEIGARLLAKGVGQKRLLSLPSSIGCEAYSLAAIFSKHASEGQSLEVHMADISEAKLRAAQTGVYPYGFHRGVLPEYRDYFNGVGSGVMSVVPEIKNMVKALPAFDIMDAPAMAVRYDMIVCLNLLCYWPDLESKVRAVQYLATLGDEICLSHGTHEAFVSHQEEVDAALREVGFSEEKSYPDYRRYKNAQFYTRIYEGNSGGDENACLPDEIGL